MNNLSVKKMHEKKVMEVCDMCDNMVHKYFIVSINNSKIILCHKKLCKDKFTGMDKRLEELLK